VPADATRADEEIRHLRSSINDLISLQTLPAIWDGRESGSILSTLLDVLVSVLRLNFAYARLSNSINGSPVEFLQLAQCRTPPPQPREIGRALDCWLTNRSANAPLTVPNPADDGDVRIVPLQLGLMDEIGVLVAGSKRADFPTPTETLLLRVAANQALVALQEARQLHDQKRAAEELERRVADRTAQLTTVNEALRESEKKYRTLFDSIDEGFCTIEVMFDENDHPIDYRFLEVNPSFEKQTGIQNARGRRMREIAPQHEEHWFEIYGRIALTGEPVRFESQATQLHRWYDAYAFRVGEPGDRKVAILFSDITERKRSEAQLLLNEAYLSEAQRLSHTGTFGWWPSSDELFWSEETFRIFQYDRMTKPTVELVLKRVHPEDAALVKQIIERASQDGKDLNFEYRLLMPDGRIKYLHVIAHASQNSSRELEFIGAVMDVTERKWAEVERVRLEQRLRQGEKMEAVGRFAGGIAHDFNNVLAGILAYGEMLFEETAAGSLPKRYAHNVLTAATRGRALVEQILAYSRSQRGKRAPIDIAAVVAETFELVRGSLPASIRLEASVPELPLVVIGDATQLHQVVMNLCSNAIQAMNGGGSLRVALEAVDVSTERGFSHGALRPGRYVRLTVEDSGSGMDEATLSHIFEPFFTTKELGRGTGLGLSLVYAIVTDSGGAIDVKSVLTQGSTFAIYLPRSDAALSAADDTAAPLPRGNGERVLLVDNEAPMLAVTAEVLTRLGYEPVPFSDSQAALAAFEAAPWRFDVVVTDEVMPGITGTGLTSVVRRHRPDLPIVLVSGCSGPILTQHTLAAGVSELLTKPLQSRAIATTLARVLHRAA
jgi:PAS domain S-box-containing protein